MAVKIDTYDDSLTISEYYRHGKGFLHSAPQLKGGLQGQLMIPVDDLSPARGHLKQLEKRFPRDSRRAPTEADFASMRRCAVCSRRRATSRNWHAGPTMTGPRSSPMERGLITGYLNKRCGPKQLWPKLWRGVKRRNTRNELGRNTIDILRLTGGLLIWVRQWQEALPQEHL
jgi:hypothetical protein